MENEYLSHWEQAIVTKTFLGHRYAMNIFRVGVNYQQPVTLFIQNDTIIIENNEDSSPRNRLGHQNFHRAQIGGGKRTLCMGKLHQQPVTLFIQNDTM